MTSDDTSGELLDYALASLAVNPPDTARSEPVRTRCHHILARRRRRADVLLSADTRLVSMVLEPVFVSVLAALFLREAVVHSLELLGR
jgi:hypothetical protein